MAGWRRFQASQSVIIQTQYDPKTQKQSLRAKLRVGSAGKFDVVIRHDALGKLAYSPPPAVEWHEILDLRPANGNAFGWELRHRSLRNTSAITCTGKHQWATEVKSTLDGRDGDVANDSLQFACSNCPKN